MCVLCEIDELELLVVHRKAASKYLRKLTKLGKIRK